MANRIVAECDIVTVGNHRIFALAYRERHKVVRVAFQRGRSLGRNCGDHALQIERVHGGLARHRIADPVRRLGDRRLPNHFRGAPRNRWGCLRHTVSFIHHHWMV